MSSDSTRDLSLSIHILQTLERIDAPYMVVGAFAAGIYGATRTTYDIDIVVDLKERHIGALAAAYPLPRYYADPRQMRDSVRLGIMFNIIDTERGEKADLVPLTMLPYSRSAFGRRIRQHMTLSGLQPFDIWCARPEDVILGKLEAWREGRSHKHETDVLDMLVAHLLHPYGEPEARLDIAYVDAHAAQLGEDVLAFWQALKRHAKQQVTSRSQSARH